MTTGDDDKVIDLAAKREERDFYRAVGAMFMLTPRDDLADDDALIGHNPGEVIVVTDYDAMTGMVFTPAAARKIAAALLECADAAEGRTP